MITKEIELIFLKIEQTEKILSKHKANNNINLVAIFERILEQLNKKLN